MTDPAPTDASRETAGILSSTAVMAAGTVVSRMSGFVRSALLIAALGGGLHADLFNIANTIPNMLYILLAGGIFNAVLVPQLVRAMKHDADGGEAYTNRIMTLAIVFLGAVTILLVAAAPWVMSIFLDSDYGTPELAAQRESVIDFARFCLPQVFFYGMFVLIGQILNSRGRFGPMMWAPIANNLISIGVLVTYLGVFGPAAGAERDGAFTSAQEALLGLGSTLGIIAQLMILLPYLTAVGYHYRPRFDFRDAGLGHTLRLGVWTVLFVIVNQIAYTVVVRLASSGTADAAPGDNGTGYTIYSLTFRIVMVPHSVVTVSLATAILPRLSAHAAETDFRALARTLGVAMRSALAVVIPFAMLLPVISRDLAHVIWGWGAGQADYPLFAPTLGLFGFGLIFFTFHYLTLRGFYSLERTRTVFWIQCVVAVVNIAAAVVLVQVTNAEDTAPALVLAYTTAYAAGSLLSYLWLRRILGGLGTSRLLRFLVRLVIAAAGSTAVAIGLALLLDRHSGDPSLVVAALRALLVTVVDVVVFVVLARLLRITEVTDVLETVTRRLPSARRG
ncbi:MAG: murein biosynthesis integral membrane protein MurJ [Nocardioides sp.]